MADAPRSSRVHERNNFDAFRLAAAVMVLAGHAFVLSGRGAEEPLIAHTAIGGLGELGVSIFFVISGFLVTMSFQRLGSTAAYLANRVLRIVPGLVVALALTAFVLGPLVTSLPAEAYLARPQTWLYVARNALLYPVTYALPGVFETNPYPGAVNGSLWTLRLEFTFYLVLPLMAWAGGLNRRGLALLAGAAGLAYLAVLSLPALALEAPAVLVIAARNFWLFAAGAALFAWRDSPLLARPAPWLAATALFLAVLPFRTATPYLAPLALPLAVVGAALRPVAGVRSASRFGDFSYGIYIYAFPVQQALMHALGPERLGVAAFAALTFACVLPLAALSWWAVERPALSLKRLVAAKLAPGPRRPPAPLQAVEPF
jgi:peptidoglycan/LPS O-acetylase OafA/YrhL